MKKKTIPSIILIMLLIIIAPSPLCARYYHRSRANAGRNRRMMPPLSYRHTWDRSDRWFNNRWWDIQEFPQGINANPFVNQYSSVGCLECSSR